MEAYLILFPKNCCFVIPFVLSFIQLFTSKLRILFQPFDIAILLLQTFSSDSEDEDSGAHTVAEDLNKVIDNVIEPLSSLKVNEEAAGKESKWYQIPLQKIALLFV